ncbi:TetR/AcrR family transcriptional regulator [Aliiroseovarius sp. YM-037]|uniref:TetR/AcrR family transcriptional regulator n=1 Tax=Aliiroseovarius sp. YM-037 TaxID=3341728 RepID=UPI003A813B7D
MTSRNAKVLDAAKKVFARYGVGKTTMNDIAREAGVARQTLYNAYPGKDELLRATVQHVADEILGAVTAAWEDADTLDEKLDIFFRLGPLGWYDLVQSSPDVAELLDGVHTVAREELSVAHERWTALFADLLRDHVPDGGASGLPVDDIAEFLYSASTNAKYNAESRVVLEKRLAVLKSSVLALLGRS